MKEYPGVELISYGYSFVAGFVFLACGLAAGMSGEISYIVIGSISACGVYAVGGIMRILIDIAKSTSIQAQIKRIEYEKSLNTKNPISKLQKMPRRKVAGE